MILKGSQRANGDDLAIHLMNGFDNEIVEIAEVYGAVAGDLFGAFAEFEAVAQGTRAQNYLYSLSINPPEPLSREQYHAAIQDIEYKLGLSDQPRAVVFHVKNGREHCHVVWSRIDIEEMKAIHQPFDNERLMDISVELARKYGFELTEGQRAWAEKRKFEKEQLEPTLAEKAQAEQSGLSAEDRRAVITSCFEQSDTGEAFAAALADRGYILARGDRRGFVVVDEAGNVLSLSRYVKGHTAKQINERLHPLTPAMLPGVAKAKELAKEKGRAREDSSGKGETGKSSGDAIAKARDKLVALQSGRRQKLASREQELLIRQQAEKLSLHAAQKADERRVIFRARRAVSEFIAKTPGLRSVLEPLQKLTGIDPRERHRLQSEELGARHQRERATIEREKRVLSRVETRENKSLERAIERQRVQNIEAGMEASTPAREAVPSRSWKRGELQFEFNEAGEFEEGDGVDHSFDHDGGADFSPEEIEEEKSRNRWTKKRDRDRER